MKVITDKNKIKEVLERGVDKIEPEGLLEKQLLSGKQIKLYFGIDPTGSVLHLGHSVVLRKLKAFQELGHKVYLLIGDFTAKIGDPTDKLAQRQPLTDKQVKDNMKTYKKQAGKILDFSKIELVYNSEWLKKLDFEKIIDLAANFSVQRLLERDMFEKRIKEGKNISLVEFLYPLMQGYDSVVLNVDLELAGSDQLFNALAGRKLQKVYNNKEKSVLTFKLLPGTDGQKMSKSLGNFIALNDEPKEMFGKIMSIKDELIKEYFELTTDISFTQIEEIISHNPNPRDQKAILGKELVKMYHSEKEALKAEEEFNKIFKEKELPSERKKSPPLEREQRADNLLVASGALESKSQAKRIIEGGGAYLIENGEKKRIKSWDEQIVLKSGTTLQIGSRNFIDLVLKEEPNGKNTDN